MATEINQEKIRKELAQIYESYISEDEERQKDAIKKAKEMDGMWSGSFLLQKEIEEGIGALRYTYLEPFLDKSKAEKILDALKEGKS